MTILSKKKPTQALLTRLYQFEQGPVQNLAAKKTSAEDFMREWDKVRYKK